MGQGAEFTSAIRLRSCEPRTRAFAELCAKMAVVTDRAPLYQEIHGDGCPIVLAHGFGGSGRNFGPQVRALRDRWRISVFDARGHARSPAEDAPSLYTPAATLADFAAVVERLGAPSAIVGGLSMGAASATRFALAYPERVRALVIAAFPRGDQASRDWARALARQLEQKPALEALAAVSHMLGAPLAGADLGLVARGLAEHPVHGLRHTLRGLLSQQTAVAEVAEALSEMDFPILLVAGGLDQGALRAAAAFERHCPRARIAVIPGAGHVVNLQAAPAFNERLLAFLREHSASLE